MIDVTGFLVRIGVRALRNSRTAETPRPAPLDARDPREPE